MKAIHVDSIMDALKDGQRGAFKFWTRGDNPPDHDGAPDGLNFVCPGCGDLGSLEFQGRRHGLGGGWTWDGSRDAPTCTPSILHDVLSCGWHGYLTAGEFRPC